MFFVYLLTAFIFGVLVSRIFFTKRYQPKEQTKVSRETVLEPRGNCQELLESFDDSRFLLNKPKSLNIEQFEKIYLKADQEKLNAFYEDASAVVKFYLSPEDFKIFFRAPYAFREVDPKYKEIIGEYFSKKLTTGRLVAIPRNFLADDFFKKIFEAGEAEICFKKTEKIDHLFFGTVSEEYNFGYSINESFCLPDGRVILEESVGMLCNFGQGRKK